MAGWPHYRMQGEYGAGIKQRTGAQVGKTERGVTNGRGDDGRSDRRIDKADLQHAVMQKLKSGE